MSATSGGSPINPAPACQPPDFSPRQPRLRLPQGACDCHAHVMGPSRDYPFAHGRIYTPPDCLADDYLAMLRAVGVSRAVLVQPSVYGTDNRLLIDSLRRNPQALRGVAVLGEGVADAELERLHGAGVRGVRVNLVDRVDRVDREARLPMAALGALARRVAPLGWHLELLAHVDQHGCELAALQDLPVPVVFGHFGYLGLERGADDLGFLALLALLRGGRTWVKLTGPYRLTRAALPYAGCDELAAALRETAIDRLVWGSDWPHVMLRGAMPNDADLLDLLSRWLPDAEQRLAVLVHNPQVLYGFVR